MEKIYPKTRAVPIKKQWESLKVNSTFLGGEKVFSRVPDAI